MGAEELVYRALYILEGIDDVEMGGGLVGRLQRFLIRGQLFQGGGQARGVPCQESAVGIGQEFPLPGDSQTDELGNERGKYGQDQACHNDDCADVSSALVVASPPSASPEKAPEDPVAKQGDDSNHDHS